MGCSEEFFRAYVGAALWSSNDDDGEPLDDGRDESDVAPEALASMRKDCDAFCDAHAELLAQVPAKHQWSSDELNGHDFWLTRNGHGVGFWDRGYGALGERLSEACRAYGGCDLYVGDDGKIHVS